MIRNIVVRPGAAALAAFVVLAAVTACSGGGGSGDATGVEAAQSCDGSCASAAIFLTVADVQRVIAQAVAEATARGTPATIAVVDRVGNVLGVFRMNGAAAQVTVQSPGAAVDGGLEGVTVVPDTLAAIAKAVTGAYLSSEGNAFSTRTASQIVQQHFNPGETLAPGGPLFGVQFSQLPCSDLNTRYAGGAPDAGPKRSPLGLAADPGGFPLYKAGTPAGAVGVIADGIYGYDANVGDRDLDTDELVALAGSFGLIAPAERRADRITADGRTLRFSDATIADLRVAPDAAPAFATIDGTAGSLVAVPGYTDATIKSGVAYGGIASGIAPDAGTFPGLDAWVLLDAAGNPRFAPRAGTEVNGALTAAETQEILAAALAVANRARGQIRQPLESPARVTISVVDSAGTVLGIAASRDVPLFGIDVSLQKARTAAFFSSAAAAASLASLPPAVYLAGGLAVLRQKSIAAYVPQLQAFLGVPAALTDGGIAFSARAIGNLARPFYPDGVDGAPAGPFSNPAGEWSPFSTGLQLDLVHNAIIRHVAFVLGAAADAPPNCTGITGFDTGFLAAAPLPALANGIQIFPGGVPVYRGGTLVGGVGVSGDGVDQDDMVAFLGVHDAGAALGTFGNAPVAARSDQLAPGGAQLRYVNCPQAPFLGSGAQDACGGK